MVESEKVKPSFYRVNEKVQIGEMDYVWKMNIYIYICMGLKLANPSTKSLTMKEIIL